MPQMTRKTIKMKLKKGTLIRIKNDIKSGEYTKSCYFNPDMKEFCGRICKITEVLKTSNGNRYKLEDTNGYVFVEEWLELATWKEIFKNETRRH